MIIKIVWNKRNKAEIEFILYKIAHKIKKSMTQLFHHTDYTNDELLNFQFYYTNSEQQPHFTAVIVDQNAPSTEPNFEHLVEDLKKYTVRSPCVDTRCLKGYNLRVRK